MDPMLMAALPLLRLSASLAASSICCCSSASYSWSIARKRADCVAGRLAFGTGVSIVGTSGAMASPLSRSWDGFCEAAAPSSSSRSALWSNSSKRTYQVLLDRGKRILGLLSRQDV
eukprot:scaffold67_cov338-Prasinococcus_capsulatus_cf.AAC.2